MKININGKNLKLTQPIKDYIDEKIHKLDRYLVGVNPIKVDAEIHSSARGKGQSRFTVELTLSMPNIVLRAEETKPNMYEAIDIVQENMERKIRDYRERFLRERKKGKKEEIGIGADDTKMLKKIIKRKRFNLGNPVSEDEAIDRMELLGHDFYVFINVRTGLQSLVYKRNDGGYGIIESK